MLIVSGVLIAVIIEAMVVEMAVMAEVSEVAEVALVEAVEVAEKTKMGVTVRTEADERVEEAVVFGVVKIVVLLEEE